MKVGTDGVLLGAWAGVRPSDRRILDVGTGTGLIALMMAQRAPEALITGVDVEEVSQARENAAASPWGGRVAFVQCPAEIRAGRTLRPDRLQSALLRRFADLPRRRPHHGAPRRAPALRPAARRGRAPARCRGPLRRDSADGRSPAFYRRLPRIPRADPLYGRTHHAAPAGQTPADGVCARKRQLRPAPNWSSARANTSSTPPNTGP